MATRRYRRPAAPEARDPLRILFLDFDGVLNSGPYIRTWAQTFYLTDSGGGQAVAGRAVQDGRCED